MKLIIRKASALDLDRLRKIDQEVIGKRMDRTDQISQAINRDCCYVSTLNSHIHGFAIIAPSSFRGMDFLDLIVVDPTLRRQGIASSLINYFKNNSQTMECWTATNMSNMPMIRLLEKLEWVPSDHREELDFEDPELFFFCRRLS